jgi:hypothetical protein
VAVVPHSHVVRSLGVDQYLGAAAMAALWRRTFTVERDHRAGPGSNAQRRGQISRHVKAELQEVIHDGKDCEVPNIKRCNASATPRPR